MSIEKVLLVGGEAHTGGTMRLFREYLTAKGAKEIRTAVFYLQDGCTENIDFYGVKGEKYRLMPWQDSTYIRDSRSKEEAERLLSGKALLASAGWPTRCYLVRHGESTDNAHGDKYSGIVNPELTEEGIRQAELTGKLLAQEGVQRIYCSPLKRAVGTARRIQAQAGGILIIDDRLREMDYGDWEGLSRNEVKQRWSEFMDAFNSDPIHNLPPNAENPIAISKRLSKFWEDLRLSVSAERLTSLVVVAHKTAGRLLLTCVQGTEIGRYRERLMDNCSISKIVIPENDKAFIEYENSTDHLHGS